MGEQWLYNYCNSTFWDSSLMNATYPSFTQCFQDTLLVWTPCGFLWLISLYHFQSLKSLKNVPLPWTLLLLTKLLFYFLLLTLVLVQLFYRIYQLDQNGIMGTIASYVSPSLIAISLILAIAMQIYSRERGQVSSGALFNFFLLLLICAIIPFTESVRSISSNSELFDDVTTIIYFALLLVIFLLNMFAEPQHKAEKVCPEVYSSFLSKIFFAWFDPMIWLGYKQPLESDDLWNLNQRDKTKNIAPNLHRSWENELKKSRKSFEKSTKHVYVNEMADGINTKKKDHDYENAPYKPSLTKVLVKEFFRTMLLAVVFKVANDLIQFISPQIVSVMIDFTEDLGIPVWQGFFYAAAMYVVAVLKAIFLQQYFHKCTLVGMRLRTALVSLIYQKALMISNAARQESTVGEIVNLMSTDAQRMMDLMTYINIIWSGPLQIIVALVFLWNQLQIAVLAGFAVMVIMIPLNGLVIKTLRKLSTDNMKFKDKRVKLMNEILNGIKVLKLYAWEESFQDQVLEIRKTELILSRKLAYFKAMSSFVWTCAPFIVSLTSFGVYLALDPNAVLDSQTTFVSLSLFNILQFPLMMVPMMFTSIVAAQVSIKRITKFLLNSEIDKSAIDRNPKSGDQITIQNGIFAWDETSEPALADINMHVKPGELVAVVGHVGCGKSSLVSALLGEMDKRNGYVGVKGSVAYVAQQAWIQNATLKDNILFGRGMQVDDDGKTMVTSFSKAKDPIDTAKFYKKVIRSTALGPDLEILSAGDQTEIGEKGINLSGGQKQRVSLARAVFNDADVYFLDDPLSAVDSHIGKHIFERVIGKRGLLKHKTRVLVTHGVHYLPHVDRIIVLEGGRITEVGSYDELLERGKNFAKFLEEFATKQEDEEDDEPELDLLHDDELSSVPESIDDVTMELSNGNAIIDDVITQEHRNSIRKRLSVRSSIRRNGTISKVKGKDAIKELNKEKLKPKNKDGKLTDAETSQIGSVKFGVFLIYMKAIGLFMCFIIITTQILYQTSKIGSSIWLSDWSEAADTLPVNESRAETGLRLGVYGALGACQAIFIFMDAYLMAVACIHAAKLLHYKTLSNIFRAPIGFFDTTPMGRIVNRFSKDVYTVDEMLPQSLRSWNGCMFNVVGTIAVIMYSTVEFGIVIIPIGLLYVLAQRFYVRTSRQLKRLESVTRSPIYSHFSETLSGVTTIRAYQHQQRFIDQSEHRVDNNQRFYYPNIVSNRWLAIRLDVIGNAIVFFAALFAVLKRGTVTGGLAGLSLSYSLQITNTLNWWVRQTSETEINVVAVERLKEYTDVKNEAPWRIEETQPPHNWPSKGAVSFERYSTRYREGLDLVLKNISCDIQPGEKVGIVGRTGAGKSSLTLALFRLIEPAGGKIVIDGIDISSIGLHDLRSKLTIIPQDPVLFSGTLRMNLDPFGYYNDEEIWNSLEQAHLKGFVSEVPEKLEHFCAEGGENLSVGQRQLVCLARALLRKSKILVLDEATAAVDLKTDDLIQETIRERFRECTVITIAHRLNTIMDYDRIIVLDAGEMIEYDSPSNLIKEESVFCGMARDAGLI